MDNIKKFEDFLDRMQGLLDNAKKQGHIIVRVEDLENTFPELKESDDERIRKAIIEHFEGSHSCMFPYKGFTKEQILAWLEKKRFELQAGHWYTCHRAFCCRAEEGERFMCEKDGVVKGFEMEEPEKYFKEVCAPAPMEDEQKPADKVEPKFKVGDKIRRKTPSTFDKDMEVARIDKDYYVCNHIGKFSSEVIMFSEEDSYELVEQPTDKDIKEALRTEYAKGRADAIAEVQKTAWSKEDEKKRTLLIDILNVNHPNEYFKVNPVNTLNMEAMHTEELVSWLESLKERVQSQQKQVWKPSDEQMEILRRYVIDEWRDLSIGQDRVLTTLYNELVKLKEE